MAKAYHRRPSDLLCITDEIAAYCLDRAVYLFGTELEAAIREAGEGAKNTQQANARQARVLAKWLGQEVKYKNPAAAPASGTTTSQGSGPVTL